jgi:hypothetical protein
MSQAEVYRSYAEAGFHAAGGTSDAEDLARWLGTPQSLQRAEQGERGVSEQTLTEAMALIESVIQELRWEDSFAVDYAVEAPAVKIKSWDMRVGLPVLLAASIISASLVYGILFVL